MMDIEKLKNRCGYDGKPQQFKYGFDLACRELAKTQTVPETQQSQQDEIDSLIFQVADMKSRLNDNYTAGQTSMYLTKQSEIDDLKAQLKAAHESRADFVEYCRMIEVAKDLEKALKNG